ncbi:MAG: NgoFVII family restriction endonuclease [Anaerostipes sp.]|nr:NgoFVII family restriction endonuclease [Anaerostipes sp.]
MEILYSNILPLATGENQRTIIDAFNECISKSDKIEIAVGYVSQASLEELEKLVDEYSIGSICLNIGMYFIEGMPESSYHTALRINRKWKAKGIGEIRIIKAFKYHGKVYEFFKDGDPFSVIMGSSNLSVLKPEASNRRQYELSAITTDIHEIIQYDKHIVELKADNVSSNIEEIQNMPLIRETNRSLTGIDLVTEVPESNVEFYKRCEAYASFLLPLKVPKTEERHMDDGKHYTKSNINVCYAAPRSKRKARDWFETQLTVSKEITRTEGYPEKNKVFFVVTDDGYWFKAHTTSDGNKQFSAVGDELILGRWLKGRLAAAGIVSPVNNTLKDEERLGMITEEMLKEYGCNQLVLKKTGQTALDENGEPLDVWMLSFEANDPE